MTHRGPVVTAVVAVAGLIGFMTANSAGALVENTAGEQQDSGVEVPSPDNPPAGNNNDNPPPEKPKAPPAEGEKAPGGGEAEDSPEAPPAPTFPAEAAYAGDAEGSDLAIAVAVKGDDAAAYLCDGDTVESWLKGSIVDGKIELADKAKTTTLTAELKGKQLTGTVEIAEETLQFTIAVAKDPAGLYRGQNGETTVGWIIMPNGTQVGIANTGGQAKPAPPLNPDEGGVMMNGERVDAEEVDGKTTFG
ncbi:MAG: hypothetical protein ACRDSK_30690 [Actinophytocola sp.]|uniref:hypothetical protein n=1 Tax=Actinophytocola sp. TaxID=1872138 RepID=UPI003D6AF5FC